MKKIQRYLERLYSDVLHQDLDAMTLVIGDEGSGKSTFMLGALWLYEQIREESPTVDSVLSRTVYDDRDAYRMKLLHSNQFDPIAAMDAAHIFYRKQTMHGDQIKAEKANLDIRTFNYFVLLGYQDWDDITDQLQRRRARHAFRIPRRGVVWGYNRDSIDEKYDTGEWPEPDLKDTFPDLSGTDLWKEFDRRDEERKRDRLESDDSPDPKDIHRQEQIKTALRAVKPWDDSRGMTQTEAAKLIDYSRAWVSQRIQEWQDGHHRDLLDEEELVTAEP